jgi:hypothetical protein
VVDLTVDEDDRCEGAVAHRATGLQDGIRRELGEDIR